MAKIHVIYDPTERALSQPELENRLGLKTAVLTVPNDMDYETAKDTIEELVTLLVKQL